MRAAVVAVLILAAFPALSTAQLADRKVLTLAAVKQMVNAAEAEAVRNNWNVSIAVVDEHGSLMAFRRMDGASYVSVEISQGKASTAARFRRATKTITDQLAEGRLALLSLDGVTALQGGLPIIVNGVVIGAVGVSGVTSEQDEMVAAAGIAALKP
ncbi:MAG: heme-binding protein [Gemmatimonadota bacterium]|nr:heme-binding protein [Gemmatimonadota bacterium]